MAEFFSERPFTRGHAYERFKDFPAHLFNGGDAIGNPAGVNVHVSAHAFIRVGVAGDFQDGNAGEADGAPAAGGEGDEIGAAGGQSSERNGVVAGRVHKDEAGSGDALRIIDDVFERAGAGFGDCAERFFEDIAKASFFVARRRIVVKAAAELAQVAFILLDAGEQFLSDLRVARAAQQEMLRAEDFGGFGEHGGSALFDKEVAAVAKRRVGGNAGKGVGAAAIQPEDYFGKRDFDAFLRGSAFDVLVNVPASRFYRAQRSAGILKCKTLQSGGRAGGPVGTAAQIMIDLVDFAPEAQDEGGRNVGMIENAFESALQLLGVGTHRLTAAFAVRESDDTINVRGKLFGGEALRDQFGGVGSAVAGSDHGDVVARAGAAIGARIAEEGRRRGAAGARRNRFRANFVHIAFFISQVVNVDVLAGCDVRRGEADDITEAVDGIAGLQRANGDFVAGWNRSARGDGIFINLQRLSGGDGDAGDGDGIGRVKQDKRIVGGGRRIDFVKHWIVPMYAALVKVARL